MRNANILETIRMIEEQKLDIRTVTMGISLLDCADSDGEVARRKIYDKITSRAANLVSVCEGIEAEPASRLSTSASPSPPSRWWQAPPTMRTTWSSPAPSTQLLRQSA